MDTELGEAEEVYLRENNLIEHVEGENKRGEVSGEGEVAAVKTKKAGRKKTVTKRAGHDKKITPPGSKVGNFPFINAVDPGPLKDHSIIDAPMEEPEYARVCNTCGGVPCKLVSFQDEVREVEEYVSSNEQMNNIQLDNSQLDHAGGVG